MVNGLGLLRLATVMTIIAACIISPLALSRNRITLLTIMFMAMLRLRLILRWPEPGIATLIVTAVMIRRPYLPGGFNYTLMVLIVLIGFWVLDLIESN